MFRRIDRKAIVPWIAPTLAVALVLSVSYLATRAAHLPPAAEGLPEGKLTELHAKQVDIVLDRAKLYFGWALGITGAIGFFLKALIDGDVSLRPRELVRIEAALGLMVASIVFGGILISNVLTMLVAVQFHPDARFIRTYATAQYWFLLAGFLFTGWFVHDFFWRWTHEKNASSHSGNSAVNDSQ